MCFIDYFTKHELFFETARWILHFDINKSEFAYHISNIRGGSTQMSLVWIGSSELCKPQLS